MSAHVLLILLKELGGKEIECEACHAFYLFIRKEFNKFNNTRAGVLDSIYMKIILKLYFWREKC